MSCDTPTEIIKFPNHPAEDTLRVGDDFIILERKEERVYSVLRNEYLEYIGTAWINKPLSLLCTYNPTMGYPSNIPHIDNWIYDGKKDPTLMYHNQHLAQLISCTTSRL